MDNDLKISLLGQSGCKILLHDTIIYCDPYLSNSAYTNIDKSLKRMYPVSLDPKKITDADYVLLSHDHIDHCDPITLMSILYASKKVKFIAPNNVVNKLKILGIPEEKIIKSSDKNTIKINNIKINTIPAAHPEIEYDNKMELVSVGYLIMFNYKKIYLSGDTLLNEYIVNYLKKYHPIDYAFLPVNEDSYYKRKKNIIGNMSIREAMWLANEIGVKTFIPVHWDMFKENSVSIDEIYSTYKALGYSFVMKIYSDIK
jgi:L-ascorbate 6-phosphate lactonase